VALGDTEVGPALAVFDLPAPLAVPAPVANDFNAHDVSGFDATPNFALAGINYNDIYRVANSTDAYAVARDSESNYEQSVTFRARLNSGLTTDRYSWVGAALRYIDEKNFYYVTISRDIITIRKRVNGVDTTINSVRVTPITGEWIDVNFRLYKTSEPEPDRKWRLNVLAGDLMGFGGYATDLTHGKAALIAHNATGDFDDFYAASAREAQLYWNDFISEAPLPFAYSGGTWQATYLSGINPGLRQSNTRGLALATAGSAKVGDQKVLASIRLDSWGSTDPVPWIGLLARYVDARNYYYLSVRGSNQLQIRKVVNGVTTVLAAKAYTPAPGQYIDYELRAYGNQLHALVDGVVLATALDDDLPAGKFGLGTYRAGATFDDIEAWQP
jgi:hypothetical protein